MSSLSDEISTQFFVRKPFVGRSIRKDVYDTRLISLGTKRHIVETASNVSALHGRHTYDFPTYEDFSSNGS